MATPVNENTALVERTITPQAWAKASHTSPVSPGEVDSSIDSIMAELNQPVVSSGMRTTEYAPWIRSREPCSGVMWASVPSMLESWRDREGGWIVSYGPDRTSPSSCYLRLSPAPEGDTRVQYGFCPIRLNKLEELKRESWEPDELHMVSMAIRSPSISSFRSDKMAISAVRLFNPTGHSPESERFLELLGRRSVGVFIEDMLRGCYADTSSGRDILRGRDSRYREMVELVATHAYSSWDNPTTEEGLDRFKNAMDVGSQEKWLPECVWPYLYDVVMPRAIFEANSRNLEAGIPPIIPHYVTPKVWMFNGRWRSPCTGLFFPRDCGIGTTGKKLVAGLLSKFNFDLPGTVSIWPTQDNPPREWEDGFVRCIERVAGLDLPLDTADRIDLVLHESHCIPVVFRVHTNGTSIEARTYKFVRMIQGQFCSVSRELQSITVRECSPAGEEWIGEEVRTGGNPNSTTTVSSTDGSPDEREIGECSRCQEELAHEEIRHCEECNGDFCRNCIRDCTDCRVYLCDECGHFVDDGLLRCYNCNISLVETDN